jgi:hypothetical protein
MKKSIILLLTILGMVTTSEAQYYEISAHAVGDTVEIVDSTTVQVLNMTIGDMSIERAKSCKVINVFRLQEYADDDTKLIPSFIGTKIHFQATDDHWNYLDLNIYVDLQANFHARGIFNGRTFTREIITGDLYYDDNDEMVPNFDWEIY